MLMEKTGEIGRSIVAVRGTRREGLLYLQVSTACEVYFDSFLVPLFAETVHFCTYFCPLLYPLVAKVQID